MSQATSMKRVRLTLARSKEFPVGSSHHGYEIDAPLDENGRIDAAAWRAHPELCRVKRFWGADEQIGRLAHRRGGAEHAQWVFDYDPARSDDDEPGYRFGAHTFLPGEYVSIEGHDHQMHTFRVASVSPAK